MAQASVEQGLRQARYIPRSRHYVYIHDTGRPNKGAGIPARLEQSLKPDDTVECKFPEGFNRDNWGPNYDTAALWTNFLECVRAKKRETLSTPELGAAAFTTVNMGVLSYRQGKVLFWDREQKREVPADASWARRWEQRSKKRGKPEQIIGWKGGNSGSVVIPPKYQELEGPWIDGKDPAPPEKSTE